MYPPHASSPKSRRLAAAETRAFTLIELLVVIAIVGVLAALSLPIYNSVTRSSRTAKCVAQLRQQGVAFYACSNDSAGVLPTVDYWSVNTGPPASATPKWDFWVLRVSPYLGLDASGSSPLFRCPEVYADQPKPTSSYWRYALNQGVSQVDANGARTGTRVSTLVDGPRKVVLFCSGRGWSSMSRSTLTGQGPGVGYGPITPAVNAPYFAEVHGGGANILYADGHVGSAAFTSIPVADWSK